MDRAPNQQKDNEQYLPSATLSQGPLMSYTPKASYKQGNVSSGEESYVPQSLSKSPTCSSKYTPYTPSKLDENLSGKRQDICRTDRASKKARQMEEQRDVVEIGSSQESEHSPLSKQEVEKEDGNESLLTGLAEKYGKMELPTEVKKRQTLRKDRPKASSSKNQLKSNPVSTVACWITKKSTKDIPGTKKKPVTNEIDPQRMQMLQKQEDNLRKRNEDLSEANRNLGNIRTKTLAEPSVKKILQLPNYTAEELYEKYHELYIKTAEQDFW